MSSRSDIARRWLRFVAGLAIMTAGTAFIMAGVTPPGLAGEVLRHSRRLDIDASPLFYSDVEHMADLEAGVWRMRQPERVRRSLLSRPICDDALR